MNRKLFVANVSWNVGEDDLYNLFAAQGAVDSMKMPVNRITGRHKGYAFIEMVNEDDAMKAVNELNGMTLDNRALAVNFQDEHRVKRHEMSLYAASPNPKLFIRNISPTATEEHLFELLSQVGKVVSVKIPVDHFNGEQRTYGFAEMATTDDAKAVVDRYNGTMMEGDELQILYADPNRINASKEKKFGRGGPPHHGGHPHHPGHGYYYPPPPYYAPYPPQHYPGYPPPPYPQDGGNYPPPPQHHHPSHGGHGQGGPGHSPSGGQRHNAGGGSSSHYSHSGHNAGHYNYNTDDY